MAAKTLPMRVSATFISVYAADTVRVILQPSGHMAIHAVPGLLVIVPGFTAFQLQRLPAQMVPAIFEQDMHLSNIYRSLFLACPPILLHMGTINTGG